MYDIYEDEQERLWLATYEGGVFVVEKDQLLQSQGKEVTAVLHYNSNQTKNSISSNIINSITPGSDGSVWLGSDDGGVNHIQNNQEISFFNTAKGNLNSDFVKSITSDSEGNIWISTDNGLSYIAPGSNQAQQILKNELNSSILVTAIQDDKLWVKTLSEIKCIDWKKNKIKSVYFDDRSYSCAYYYPPGKKMYMGTSDGFIVYSPDTFLLSTTIPHIAVTNILLANQPVEVGKEYDRNVILSESLASQSEITLHYTQNSFSLEFSSFYFLDAKKIRYAYRLKGFDDNWHENEGSNNRASFINVPSDSYVFEVQNIDSEGNKIGNIASLKMNITPPWYSSIYAISIYILIIFLILFQLWRMLRYSQLLKYERMEREKTMKLTKMKLDFFANVSHEFKTPLSLILGHTGQLILKESNSSQKTELSSIQKNARKMHLLINQMMEYNNKETIQEELILTETSLSDFASEIFTQFYDAFKNKDVHAEFQSEDIPYIFLIDQAKMESVFTNLLSNALKFVSPGGNVRMSLSINKETETEVIVSIQVVDDGCGIAEVDLNRVFERYFKSPATLHLNKEGSGIGLSLVKDMVERHDGNISIYSKENEGTTVEILLTVKKHLSFVLNRKHPESLFHSPEDINCSKKLKILIVEDNEELQRFIVKTFSTQFDFITANNGKEGLDKAIRLLPDLIISDVMMPKMDGLVLSQNLKNNVQTAFIPIIILTAKNDRETELNSFKYADAFVAKPFDINYLGAMILQLATKSKRMEEKVREKEIIQPRKEDIVSPDEIFLKEITEMIENDLSNSDLNVALLCEKNKMGTKQVYRKIKLLTGMSVVEYIRNIRIKKAAMYLRQKKLSISEIMYLVGFSNHSYFSKCFKEEYGMTPKEFVNNFTLQD
jgi:signal transduction histidine kinase/DNA-binding response OmpR family regulator